MVHRINSWQRRLFGALLLTVGCGLAFPGIAQDKKETGPEGAVVRPADIQRLARQAPPTVADLCRELAQPADLLDLADVSLLIVPHPALGSHVITDKEEIAVTLVQDGKAGMVKAIAPKDVVKVTWYEERAWQRIDRLLSVAPKGEAEAAQVSQLVVIEKVLQAVLRFHEGRRVAWQKEAGPVSDVGWRLRNQWLDVNCRLLDLQGSQARADKDWQEALQRAERLLAIYPHGEPANKHVRQLWARYGVFQVAQQDWKTARWWLDRIEGHFLHSPEAVGLRQALHKRGEQLVQQAAQQPPEAALRSLQEASVLWPHLPGLQETLRKRQNTYQILYVGVPRLPEFLSPALATSEVERQALELLFASLVQPTRREGQGWKYDPLLAAALPVVEPLTRTFTLVRQVRWPNGDRLAAADIRHTADLLSRSPGDGQATVWRDLLQVPRLETNPWQITIPLRQGCLEPLRFFTFPILPQTYQGKALQQADDPAFGRSPIGTGPFVYQGLKKDGRIHAHFTVNPYYDRRGLSEMTIREIRLVEWPGPTTKDQLRPHLLLDVPTDQLGAVQAGGWREVSVPGRRVFILAVNHRVPKLANHQLRRVLAHALDREQLLRTCFRGGLAPASLLKVTGAAIGVAFPLREGLGEFHRLANGPFPPGSWACCPPPRVPLDPHEVALARSAARQVKAELGDVTLSLQYPDDDPRIAQACHEMARQIEQVAGSVQANIRIKPVPVPLHQLRQALARHQYELAYWHFDYADDWYWLWPCFDPHPEAVGPGGSNFLGYDNDAKLLGLLRAALSHRHFPTVQELTHAIHAHLYDRMPFIPLWQLHLHVALHPSLQTGEVDPRWIWRGVGEWRTK